MPTLAEIRQQNPQYGDLSDTELADKLHSKFYSDMPREEFDNKLKVKKEEPKAETLESAVAGARKDLGKVPGEARKVLSKINEESIAGTLGAPVDLTNAALRGIGLPTSDQPFLGSKSIKSGMRALGMSEEGAEPETLAGKAVATVGGGATEALLSGGGIGGLMKAGGKAMASPALQAAGKVMASPGANIAAGGGGAAVGGIAKEATKGTPFEKPAEIVGEAVGGGLTGLKPSTALRGLKASEPVLAAYERLKLAPSVAEASRAETVGGRAAQWLEGNILPQTIGGGGVMERFKQQRKREISKIQQMIADQYGSAKSRFEMGKSVQESVMDTWNQVRDADGRLIGALKQKYGPDVIYPDNFVNAVANPIGGATTKEVREQTLDPLVQKAAATIRATGGHLTFNDLGELKGLYGGALEPGPQKNVNDAQVSQLFNAVRKDMEQHIKTKSPDDFKQLQASNKRYSTAMDDFKTYFKKLIRSGDIPVSSEKAYDIVTGAATEKGRGDLEEFRHVWDALPPEKRGDLAATIFSRMGAMDMNKIGDLETWSMGKFLTSYRDLSAEAKDMLFKGKKDVARSMDDLVAVVQNIDIKVRNLQSTSKSNVGGMLMLGQFGLGATIGHFAAGDWAKGILMSMGGPWVAAQMLTNSTVIKAMTETMRRVDAAIDASARAVIDLNAIPKIPSARRPQPTVQSNQQPQVPMSQ